MPFFLSLILLMALIFGHTDKERANLGAEIAEKRTLNSKTFDNGDGTFTLEAHGGHIHYVDKATGKLKECDTTLIDMGDKWIQTKASYHCEIPKYADRDFAFIDLFENKNQTVVMRPLAGPVLGEIDNSDGWVNKRVLYRNAYGKGLHLRVTAGNVGLFKEIIIDEMPKPLRDLSFDFEVTLPSEEHVYVLEGGEHGTAKQVLLANLTLTGDQQLLMGQGPMAKNASSRIRKIRIWDSDENAMAGRLEFYRKGAKLYCRKIVPKEFLATATYPVYTDDTATYYAGAGDGYVAGGAGANNWNAAHDLLTGQLVNYTGTGASDLAIASGRRTDNAALIYRGFFPINATGLPDTCTITAASLFFGINTKKNDDNDGYDYIAVVGETTQTDPDLLSGVDYDTCGTTHNPTLGSAKYDITSIATGQYLEMVLNATGISWIRKSGAGDNAYSRFGVREGHDIEDHPHAGVTNTWNYVTGPQSNYAGTAYDPKLSVTYTAGETTHYVNKDNTSPQTPYDTWAKAARNIQDAIDVCEAGTVIVRKAAATSYSAITMKSNVDVVCEDLLDRPIINGSPGVTFQGPLNNCTLDGFRFVGGSADGQVYFNGLGGAVADVTIRNCSLQPPICGIGFRGAVSPTIELCDIGGTALGGLVYPGASGSISSTGSPIVIRDCHIYNCARTGIYLNGDGANDIIIEGTHIEQNGYSGIRLYNFKSVTLDNNNIHDNGTGGIGGVGIRIQDVSSAIITRSDIYDNLMAGIAIEGNCDVTIGADLAEVDPFPYGNDIYGNIRAGVQIGEPSATAMNGELVIRGNYIHNNGSGSLGGGIWIGTAVLSATISQNEIAQNNLGGIGIRGVHPSVPTAMVIAKNNIHDNLLRGGIHTGDKVGNFANPGNFTADSTIKQNKVHHNSNASHGGGIDVRHFKGTIKNNLVYRNARGGIRYGDYVSEIINNTVVHNGQNDRGGGIIYNDLTGAVNARPTGTCSTSPLIKNNIVAYSEKAGIRVGGNGYDCPADNPGYDYNLLYANYPWNDVWSRANPSDCGWPTPTIPDDYTCTQQQYGGCGAYVDSGIVLNNPNDIMAYPEFVDEDADNYHLKPGVSPAENAGEGGVDMGAYGGSDPMVDSEIPQF
jgi:hypothetical protein